MNWRSSGVSIQGDLDDDCSYAFHGSGCVITSPDMEMDFEFDEFVDDKKLQEVFDVAVVNKLLKKDEDLYRLVNYAGIVSRSSYLMYALLKLYKSLTHQLVLVVIKRLNRLRRF